MYVLQDVTICVGFIPDPEEPDHWTISVPLTMPGAPKPQPQPVAIHNLLFADGTSGDWFEGLETWEEFLERKGQALPPRTSP